MVSAKKHETGKLVSVGKPLIFARRALIYFVPTETYPEELQRRKDLPVNNFTRLAKDPSLRSGYVPAGKTARDRPSGGTF